jgi:hypothetical protein
MILKIKKESFMAKSGFKGSVDSLPWILKIIIAIIPGLSFVVFGIYRLSVHKSGLLGWIVRFILYVVLGWNLFYILDIIGVILWKKPWILWK